ncbi:MAG: pilus assembly PilX N-terminal domain-containing protein [Patescibacteria group bacterium]
MRFSSTSHLRGSVLVFSLIILSFLLVSGISVATIATTETRTSLSADRSSVAFQAADSGAEIVLNEIYSVDYDLCPSTPASGKTCQLDELGTCADDTGTAILSGSLGQSTYAVIFYTSSGQISSCSDTSWRNQAERLQSAGTYAGTVRAIEAGIDPP